MAERMKEKQETGMDSKEVQAAIEAVLFAEGDSVGRNDLACALGIGREEIEQAISALMAKYDREDSGIRLIELGDAVQLSTKPQYYDILIRLEAAPKKMKLSDAVLETLSIIAYRQPVTKAEIEAIRGVNSDFAVDRLIGYDLVRELGRKEAPGRPILFGTTEQFLRSFGVKSIQDLPTLSPDKVEEFKAEAEEEAGEEQSSDGQEDQSGTVDVGI